ncbi:hypothetical protein AbraIFM66951_009882 [Aspergillus brasiliensis]|uniref:Transcriptional regulator n=1 Tax=Aspergillus brasiliensis TaxID=319629 RepID=A0A9W5YTM3_9EURO|nr:hypothetical protein AbraCBS73388_010174 [Aspergillus brasiliensis]GKZ46737.1 hypothetical protein AbraIFM66951_009882 [Aspergillus brasiliensis]
MYMKEIYTDSTPETLHTFIQQNPLGVLTTAIPSPTHPLLQSTHIPWVLDIPPTTTDSNNKVKLRGHIARSNPQCAAILDSVATEPESQSTSQGTILPTEVLLLFTSPYHSYITPHFYTTTKPLTGKVAPTWNYAAVQVYGRARIYNPRAEGELGTQAAAFLDRQLRDLSAHCEGNIMGYNTNTNTTTGNTRGKGEGREGAWTVDDAPEAYINILKKNIVGIEVTVERMDGKFKMSQERGDGDREGVVRGLVDMMGGDIEKGVARMVRECAGEK